MFESLLREIKRLDRLEVSVPIETDKDGYIDKECPSGSCMFKFKVHKDDWANIFRDEAVYCPLCRHEAPADSWWTTEQIEHAKRQALKHVKGRIGQAMETDARTFNFQKRHILVHNEGIVDDKYIKRSGDSTYQVGQRIVVAASDIRRLVDLIGKLASEIRAVT